MVIALNLIDRLTELIIMHLAQVHELPECPFCLPIIMDYNLAYSVKYQNTFGQSSEWELFNYRDYRPGSWFDDHVMQNVVNLKHLWHFYKSKVI